MPKTTTNILESENIKFGRVRFLRNNSWKPYFLGSLSFG
jgi:hypothetical protein